MKSKLIFISTGVAVVILAVFLWKCSGSSNADYQQIIVSTGNIQETILSTGVVEPENRLEIKPPIAGRADEVFVDEGDVVKKGHKLILMSSSERAALLDAARAKGDQELKRWETFYKPVPILAPIDGTIIARNIEPGQSFTSSDAILTMSDRLTVKAQVDETDIAKIKLRQNAIITLDAYPDTKIPAKVDKIAFDSKTVNNVTTYIVDVLPDTTPDFMRSGMTANVTFIGESRENVLIIPIASVKNKDGKQFVIVDSESTNSNEMLITTGITDGKFVEIISGLKEGDIIYTKKSKSLSNLTETNNSSTPLGLPRPGSKKRN